MASKTINLASPGIGTLTNIGVSASTGDYYQTGSLSSGGGTLQIYIPIDILTAIGVPASCVTKITFNYSIAQERYGIFSSAGTVATGFQNGGGGFTQVVNHAKGIGKGTSSYEPYNDPIASPYYSGNTIVLAMKITNVINFQTCYYRIKGVSFTIEYIDPYTITVNSNNSNWGTATGGGSYYYGSTATLTATAVTGYEFVKWSDGSTDNPRSITVTSNATYTAEFKKKQLYFSWSYDYPACIDFYINGVCQPYDKTTDYFDYGSILTIEVVPKNTAETRFVKWKDNDSTENPRTIRLTENTYLYAVIEYRSYTVTFEDDEGNLIKVESVKYGERPSSVSAPEKADTVEHSYSFDGWYDEDGNKCAPFSVVITKDTVFVARYNAKVKAYYITANSHNNEHGTVVNGGYYLYGDTVILTAKPNAGYKFVQWIDGNTDNPRTVTVKGDATYTAVFENIQPPKIVHTQLLYSNKQISADNKVPVGEYFRIVVGVQTYD